MDTGVKVYVANYAAHDFGPAKAYGELRFITKGFISFQGLDRVKYQVAEGLKDTNAEDWLALSGANILNVLAALLWYDKHKVVKILNFDKNSRQYREIIVTPDNNLALLEVMAEQA